MLPCATETAMRLLILCTKAIGMKSIPVKYDFDLLISTLL